MTANVFEILKAFGSGIFTGMANDQAKRRDYQGTKWRADVALRLASNPYSKTFAYAVSAKADLLGNYLVDAKNKIDLAFSLIQSTPEIGEFKEVRALVAELEAMRSKLG